jgi:hypothetical protein
MPALFDVGDLSAQILGGNVEFATFKTSGLADAKEVFEALKVKYGPPDSTEQVSVKSMSGGEFSSINAYWAFENLVVSFKGAAGRVDQGIVIVGTKKGMEFEKKLADQSKGPEL